MVAKYVEKLRRSRDEHQRRATSSRSRPIEEAIEDIRAGKMVVVFDDEDRENEGDLVMAAQFATPEAINFMAKQGRGLICLALTPERCDELGLDLMAAKNESPLRDRRSRSRSRRARASRPASPRTTARTRSRSRSTRARGPRDLVQPGHVFPLKAQAPAACSSAPARPRRRSTSRASPGSIPAGVICEIMNDDGTMARVARPRAVLRASTG